ncbi:MAG: restriction endonuclease [Bacteroidetes bacterium]|nr:restriction endonuclease [Bacteroidota bacterium]
MKKIKEAITILKELGLPKAQQNDRSALTLLALCNLGKNEEWEKADAISVSVAGSKSNPKYPGIMKFIKDKYKIVYAENSRETFRRFTLHQFVQANLVEHNPENKSIPTNSPDNHYRLTKEALKVIREFKTDKWGKEADSFKKKFGLLKEKYSAVKTLKQIPLTLSSGEVLKLSPGKHNNLQALIITDFASRFAQNSILLYLGDTAKKNLYLDSKKLASLKIPITKHSKLPDVLIYDEAKDWLYLIEAVTSHGPVSPKRFIELENALENCKAGRIYVSAFLDFSEFKKHISNIAWETEVWIAENPDHLIHFNGDRFMGPR